MRGHRWLSTVAAGLVMAFLLAACDNTIRGIGRDIRETGDAIQDSVE